MLSLCFYNGLMRGCLNNIYITSCRLLSIRDKNFPTGVRTALFLLVSCGSIFIFLGSVIYVDLCFSFFLSFCLFSFGHCIVCSSLNYCFWLPLILMLFLHNWFVVHIQDVGVPCLEEVLYENNYFISELKIFFFLMNWNYFVPTKSIFIRECMSTSINYCFSILIVYCWHPIIFKYLFSHWR